jgi:type IX secretion system PorP/SprF family membrane protein
MKTIAQIKIYFYITLFLLLVGNVSAQQEPLFTQNMFYSMTFNPGYAGNENAICALGANRIQWAGFKDQEGNRVTPETFFINVNAPIRILRGGVSAQVMQDKIGFTNTVGVKIGYAYQRTIGFGKLGIGTQIEFNNRTMDFSQLKPLDTSDPVIISGEQSDMLIDFSLGLFYRVPGSYYIGVAGTHLLQSEGAALSESGANDLRMILNRTFYLHGGYEFVFPGNPAFELQPSVMVQSNLSSFQLDVAAIIKYKDTFWGGLNYRLQDAVGVIIGARYKDFKIGYSYDFNVSRLNQPIGGGSHEIMLGYCFRLEIEKGRKRYKNTRFL